MSYLKNQELLATLTECMIKGRKNKLKKIFDTRETELRSVELYLPLQEYLKASKAEDRHNAFITINWKPGTTPENTHNIITNIITKKWIDEYAITWEQRGEDEDSLGTGYHNHILLINLEKPKSQIHREIYSTVKNLVGNKFHVDVRMIPASWIDDKLEYMKGNKWDPAKAKKAQMDKLFRSKYELDHVSRKYAGAPRRARAKDSPRVGTPAGCPRADF